MFLKLARCPLVVQMGEEASNSSHEGMTKENRQNPPMDAPLPTNNHHFVEATLESVWGTSTVTYLEKKLFFWHILPSLAKPYLQMKL